MTSLKCEEGEVRKTTKNGTRENELKLQMRRK